MFFKHRPKNHKLTDKHARWRHGGNADKNKQNDHGAGSVILEISSCISYEIAFINTMHLLYLIEYTRLGERVKYQMKKNGIVSYASHAKTYGNNSHIFQT